MESTINPTAAAPSLLHSSYLPLPNTARSAPRRRGSRVKDCVMLGNGVSAEHGTMNASV